MKFLNKEELVKALKSRLALIDERIEGIPKTSRVKRARIEGMISELDKIIQDIEIGFWDIKGK